MKYSRKELNNYIMGNDTETDIEILENDPEFMLEVILSTHDKNFYELCSTQVKLNYEFVKKVVLIFNADSEFICKVANTYFENTADKLDDIDELEFLVIMQELLEKNKSEESMRYSILVSAKFQSHRLMIELAKIQNPELENIGMGFLDIYDKYNSSSFIINNFAKRMISDIFDEYDIDLEKYLHEQFDNFDKLEKIGIRTYLLEFISCYDDFLSSYLSTHLNLLDELLEKINKIRKNWNSYINKAESLKYNQILDYVHKYMEEIQFETSHDEVTILYYIATELGIAQKLLKYDSSWSMVYQEDFTEDEYLSEIKKLIDYEKQYWDFNDFRHYYNLKNMIKNILSGNIPEKTDDGNREDNRSGDIIDFNPLKR